MLQRVHHPQPLTSGDMYGGQEKRGKGISLSHRHQLSAPALARP